MNIEILTQPYLKNRLSYSQETGIFIWLPRLIGDFKRPKDYGTWTKKFCGREAGYTDPRGCIFIRIDHHLHRAHRLAFLYMTGSWPDDEVDHEDHNPSNNKWDNIRQATHAENCKNQSIHNRNKSGFTGVHRRKDTNRWLASIKANGKPKNIGNFATKQEAIEARKKANLEYGYHENHGQLMSKKRRQNE